MPVFRGQQDFRGRIVHQKYIGTEVNLSDPAITHVTVLGGGKSTGDMVYESVKAGKHVSWIIRKNGVKPGIFSPPGWRGKCENATEQGSLRIDGYITPSVLTAGNRWVAWLLHGT